MGILHHRLFFFEVSLLIKLRPCGECSRRFLSQHIWYVLLGIPPGLELTFMLHLRSKLRSLLCKHFAELEAAL